MDGETLQLTAIFAVNGSFTLAKVSAIMPVTATCATVTTYLSWQWDK
jgi:hypothetical protein